MYPEDLLSLLILLNICFCLLIHVHGSIFSPVLPRTLCQKLYPYRHLAQADVFFTILWPKFQ